MSIITNLTENPSPIKQKQRKLISRKSLPLPILSLQTRDPPTPQKHGNKKIKQSKSLIRQNFKKMLQILDESKKKSPFVPNCFQNRTVDQSKQQLRRRMKSNFQTYNPKINHLIFRAHIIDVMEKIEINQSKTSEKESTYKQSIPNLHRTIRFTKKNKKSGEEIKKSTRFMKWQSFCTSVSYHNKTLNNLPTLQMKKPPLQRSYLKQRSQSSFGHMTRNDDVNGWQDGPVRYLTDYDHTDFSDIYN